MPRNNITSHSNDKTPSKRIKLDSETTGNGTQASGDGNTLMWFRSDLRTKDNRAFESAIACAKKAQEAGPSGLFTLFIISPGEWKNHDLSDIKVQFILRNLKDLSEALNKLNIPLIFKVASSPDVIPSEIVKVCKKYGIKNVFYNIEYEVNEANRDSLVSDALINEGILIEELHDQCVVIPGKLKTKSTGTYFSVFTPFKNAWLRLVELDRSYLKESEVDPKFKNDHVKKNYSELFNKSSPEFTDFKLSAEKEKIANELFPSGEAEALKRLDDFASEKASKYKEKRDFPGLPGTSCLSPYLSVGVVSARQCINRARKQNKNKLAGGSHGIDTWITEVIWRDFYRHVLVGYPRVSKSLPFKLAAKTIKWSNNEDHFKAWKEGKTGYPIIDAGMRQLLAIGWMHNRVRMITAMFLTKDLLINWQKGEAHFMKHLIDGDLASNNGGWQWSASTGTDSQPYFRVFNPTTQSEKYDPNGDYIKKWVPELKNVDSKSIHDPFNKLSKSEFVKLNYPKPIVDHAVQRKEAIALYEKALKKSS